MDSGERGMNPVAININSDFFKQYAKQLFTNTGITVPCPCLSEVHVVKDDSVNGTLSALAHPPGVYQENQDP